jgi:hypothetical protein
MPRLRGIMSNLNDRSGNVKPERFYVLRFCFGGGRDILVCLMSDARRFPPPWTVNAVLYRQKTMPGQKLACQLLLKSWRVSCCFPFLCG